MQKQSWSWCWNSINVLFLRALMDFLLILLHFQTNPNTTTTNWNDISVSLNFLFLCYLSKFGRGQIIMGTKTGGVSFSISISNLLPFGLIFCFVITQRFTLVCGLNYTYQKHLSSLRLDRIQRHLDSINKPPLLTIQVIIIIVFNSLFPILICLC